MQLPALGAAGPYAPRRRQLLTDVYGRPAAELAVVPNLYIVRTVAALRAAAPLPPPDRLAALDLAGRLFADGEVDGVAPEEYVSAVSRLAGIPAPAVRSAMRRIKAAATDGAARLAQAARPRGAVGDWRLPAAPARSAVWTRRADVLAVHAPGNHPAVQSAWLEALALGYRVAVRPSTREPLTPYRLVAALRAGGFGAEQVAFLPTDYAGAATLLEVADLGLVYGGSDVVERHRADPRVLVHGPGRAKILLTRDADWYDALDTITESVAADGGLACVNATAVLVEGDPAPLARALADRLQTIKSHPPEDDEAALPVRPLAVARSYSDRLRLAAAGTQAWLAGDGIADDLGDGTAALRPAVHQLSSATAPQVGLELPFPCAWVAPWRRSDCVAALRNSLVVTAMTDDTDLLDQLVAEPTVRNLHIGHRPTCAAVHGAPHDGYLAEFLMHAKTVLT